MIKLAVTFNGKLTSEAWLIEKAYDADLCTHSNLIIAANVVARKESRTHHLSLRSFCCLACEFASRISLDVHLLEIHSALILAELFPVNTVTQSFVYLFIPKILLAK
jgi:hypothetical protein